MKPKTPVPYQRILDLPEWKVGEIIGGELIVSPRPAPRHAQASSVVGEKVGTRYRFGGGDLGGW